MAKQSGIGWTGPTWNPWYGCDLVSPGCKHCYAAMWAARCGLEFFGNVQRSKTTFHDPLKWHDPELIFTCSLGDWFHRTADPWRAEAYDVVRQTGRHAYQMLTKRIEDAAERLPADWLENFTHCALGTSIESQAFEWRGQEFANIPKAGKFFLSCEPLLGPLTLSSKTLDLIDWAIIGGESGSKDARRMDPAWVRRLIAQLDEAGIPPFVKQLGKVLGKEVGCADKKGEDSSVWPADLVRQESPDWGLTVEVN